MAAGLGDRGAMRAFDAGDFAEQLPIRGIHDHHAVLWSDEPAIVSCVGYDVIPTAVSTQRVSMRDPYCAAAVIVPTGSAPDDC